MNATIEQAREEWSYDQMKANYYANRNVWVEVSPTFADQALNVLPPIYIAGGFMVSEAECHTAQGRAVYAGFTNVKGRWFARYATRTAFPSDVTTLIDSGTVTS